MIEQFFKSQIDYIFFIYGLVFIILYAVSQTQSKKRLDWEWFGYFSLFSGLGQWIMMVEMSWKNNFLPVFHFIFITLSFFFLIEFVRVNFHKILKKSPPRWIYLPLVCLLGAGSFAGLSGLCVTAHYLGLIACAGAAFIFYKTLKYSGLCHRCIKVTAGGFISYGLLLTVDIPHTNFLTASIINKAFFFNILHFPVQIAGILIIILITLSLWMNFFLLEREKKDDYADKLQVQYSFGTALLDNLIKERKKKEKGSFTVFLKKVDIIGLLFSRRIAAAGMFSLLFITVICGWVGTDTVGKDAERILKFTLLTSTKMISSALPCEKIKTLSGTEEDLKKENYKYLKDRLMHIKSETPDCRYLYLMEEKKGEIIFLVDSEIATSKDYSPPGEVYNEASEKTKNLLIEGNAFVEGPVTDRWGTWITGISPLSEKEKKERTAFLGMDIEAKDWEVEIYRYRRDSIMITLFISILLILFFIIHQKSLETSQKIARAEKDKIENELKIAHEIQMGLVPKVFPPFPEHKEFSIYAYIEPARQVGGDLYDFFMQNDRHLCFAIGDVSDKGVPASLFMAVAKSLFRTIASKSESPGMVLTNMNKEICPTNESLMFITFFCGILDIKTGKLTYSNAGHNIPYIVKDKEALKLEKPCNCVLGVNEDEEYMDKEYIMKSGDYLFTYTDGITEAMNEDNQEYGDEQLKIKLETSRYLSPEKMIKAVKKSINTFTAGCEQSDDITMLAIKYMGDKK